MFERAFFKVEEIGIWEKVRSGIFLKGRKDPFFEKEELVRYFSTWDRKCQRDIVALMQSTANVEPRFARNVFQLADCAIKEVRITLRRIKIDQKVNAYRTSDVKLSNGSFIYGAVPHNALMYALAGKQIVDGLDIYCYDNSIDRKNVPAKFKKIEDIRIEDKKPEVVIDEDKYEELDFDQVLMESFHPGYPPEPESIVYQNGSNKYVFSFPKDNVTVRMALDDQRSIIILDSPAWEADSITVIDNH